MLAQDRAGHHRTGRVARAQRHHVEIRHPGTLRRGARARQNAVMKRSDRAVHARAAAPRPERVEPREPVHGLGRCRPDRRRARAKRAAPARISRAPASSPTSCTRRSRCARSTPPSSRCTSAGGRGSRCAARGGSTNATTARCRARTRRETAQEFGADKVKIWRRCYDVRPPLADRRPDSGIDERYDDLPATLLPARRVPEGRARAHAALVGRRRSCPTCAPATTVLVAAHGNSLRALVKHLDGMTPEAGRRAQPAHGRAARLRARRRALQPPAAVGPGGVRGRYLDPEASGRRRRRGRAPSRLKAPPRLA